MAALLDFESVLPVPYVAPVAAGSLSYTHGGCYPGTGTQGGECNVGTGTLPNEYNNGSSTRYSGPCQVGTGTNGGPCNLGNGTCR